MLPTDSWAKMATEMTPAADLLLLLSWLRSSSPHQSSSASSSSSSSFSSSSTVVANKGGNGEAIGGASTDGDGEDSDSDDARPIVFFKPGDLVWVWDEMERPKNKKKGRNGDAFWGVYKAKVRERVPGTSNQCSLTFGKESFDYGIDRIFKTKRDAERDLDDQLED